MNAKSNIIKPYFIDSGHQGPRVLILGGVHGDEYEPMLACIELIRHLSTILIRGNVTIVPIANPSAYLAGSRMGQDKLDLARICPGNALGSDSERAANQVSVLIQKADYLIDLHTGGWLLDIYPFAGYMLHSSIKICEQQREMAKAFNLPLIWGTDSLLNGRTLSIARDAEVPAIYVEYGGGGAIRHKIVDTYKEGCCNVLFYLRMTKKRGTIKSNLKYTIEDPTPNAGYLQQKMPAPKAGVFFPEISVGEMISKGQRWGTITTMPDGSIEIIQANDNGIALFLRTPGFVQQGDSLGGLLNINKNSKTNMYG